MSVKILVAEDNLVNQKVAVCMLEKLGHTALVANDGLEAVEKWRTGEFSLIFMDCQMPEMSGYEATEEIRRLEQGGGHTPIVALTAHAMKGDRQRCLDSGMDDYLSKPVSLDQLRVCVDRWLALQVEEEEAGFDERCDTLSDVIDWNAILRSVGNDEEILREILEIYVDDTPRQLEGLTRSLEEGDAETACRHAHTIKGSSANVGAHLCRGIALELEQQARAGDLSTAPQLLKTLQTQFGLVKNAIAELAKKDGPIVRSAG